LSTLDAAGTVGGALFLAWVTLRLVAWVLQQLVVPTPKEVEAHLVQAQVDAGIGPERARERAARVTARMAHQVAPIPGHCLHAPKCIGHGEPDERDPLGCRNCGTRENERKATT
jgi:hypothetical protein